MLASKTFTIADQERFATLTGDFNPLHMDPIAARRTTAGAPVVHGIHTLLWVLENIGAQHTEIDNVATLKARFHKMVYLGDQVEARVTQRTSTGLQAEACVGGVRAISLTVGFGPLTPAASFSIDTSAEVDVLRTTPRDLELQDMEGQSGRVGFATDPVNFEAAFPNAARLIGPHRVAALGSSTYLVGMVVPGLHSIYAGLELRLTADPAPIKGMHFTVTSVDPRFHAVYLDITGSGVSGSVKAFSVPPVSQPSMAAVAEVVTRGEFAGSIALIVGGSRGLGELSAKVAAAGGATVIITYASGKADAERVAAEINEWGGKCEVAFYDVRQEADGQLGALMHAPTHLYYFATPSISKRKASLYTDERFAEFNDYYIRGFQKLVEAALRRRPEGITVFYPSSVYVEERPADMTEYAMSKAAGEILCADIATHLRNVRMFTERLPRLPTDQTASLVEEESTSALSVMLPIVRRCMSAPAHTPSSDSP